jgi:hypothetical protein
MTGTPFGIVMIVIAAVAGLAAGDEGAGSGQPGP